MGLPIDPETGKAIIQGYVPNNALTIAAMAAFGAIAIACIFRFFRSGRPRYMLWTVIGSFLMACGFAVRIKVHSDPTSIPIYAISNLLILVAPCAFIAQDYYILPHLAAWLAAEDCLFLKARLVGRIFLISDGITFFLQLSGSGLTAKADMAHIGNTVALIGLIAQLISFGIFMLLGALFIVRLRRFHPSVVSDESRLGTKFGQLRDWRTVFLALAWTCVGILIRCVFRVIEFSQGYDGWLRTTEWCFYVFDTLPLLAAIVVWVFVWPPSALAEPALGHYAMSSATFAPKDGYPPISRV